MPGRESTRARCTSGWRRHDHDRIDALFSAGLEQQRDVEHDPRAPRVRLAPAGSVRDRAHQRVHDRFEPPDRIRIADELFRRASPRSTLPSTTLPGNACLDRRDRLARIKPVHHRVGIVQRHAGLAKEFRRGRLAHADRAGEAEDEHQVFAKISASIIARCSGITFGATPNQWVKPAPPGRAACSGRRPRDVPPLRGFQQSGFERHINDS
jgi:hypothetical protein